MRHLSQWITHGCYLKSLSLCSLKWRRPTILLCRRCWPWVGRWTRGWSTWTLTACWSAWAWAACSRCSPPCCWRDASSSSPTNSGKKKQQAHTTIFHLVEYWGRFHQAVTERCGTLHSVNWKDFYSCLCVLRFKMSRFYSTLANPEVLFCRKPHCSIFTVTRCIHWQADKCTTPASIHFCKNG